MPAPAMRARQGGAAAIFAAVSLVAGIAALALAVDVGRLYFAQRDLQRIANLAALDAARVASGCTEAVRDRLGSATAEVQASVARNSTRPAEITIAAVRLGQRRTDPAGIRYFQPSAPAQASAVHVALERRSPPRLVPGITGGNEGRTLRASADAYSGPVASFEVQPRGADQSGGFNPIPGLLGYNGSAQIMGAGGLATAEVRLGDLSAAAGFGTPDEFLRTEIAGVDLLDALAHALTDTGDAAVRASVDALRAGADATRRLVPGEILRIPPGFEDPAAAALVDVGQLVVATAEAVNRTRPVDLPVEIAVPGYTQTASARVRFIPGSEAAVGPAVLDEAGFPATFAETARVNAQLRVALPATATGVPVTLSLAASAVEGRAELLTLDCPQMDRAQPSLSLRAQARLTALRLGGFTDPALGGTDVSPVPVATMTALGVVVRILASGSASAGASEDRTLRFTGPFDPEQPQRQSFGVPPGGSTAAAVGELRRNLQLTVDPPTALTDPLLRPLVEPVVTEVAGILDRGLRDLDAPVFDPVLRRLGMTVGGAEVLVHEVRAAPPSLFTR